MIYNKYFFKDYRCGIKVEPKTDWQRQYLLTKFFLKEIKYLDYKQKIYKLIELSKIKFNFRKGYHKRRNRKHKVRLNTICPICKINKATCQHHLILLKNNGFDSSVNRIPICDCCHKEVHNWL